MCSWTTEQNHNSRVYHIFLEVFCRTVLELVPTALERWGNPWTSRHQGQHIKTANRSYDKFRKVNWPVTETRVSGLWEARVPPRHGENMQTAQKSIWTGTLLWGKVSNQITTVLPWNTFQIEGIGTLSRYSSTVLGTPIIFIWGVLGTA